MTKRGFTLIELLLVIVLLSIVGVITFPVGIQFYKVQIVDDTVSELTGTLRTAQNYAVSQKHDNSYGVKLVNNSFVLFEGSTYNSRVMAEDITIPFSTTVSLSGLDEIVFAQGSGIPDTPRVIDIAVQDESGQIIINAIGTIEP